MNGIRTPFLWAGLLLFLLGIAVALTVGNVPLRYVGTITAVAIALGLLRRAFRVE